MTDQRSQPWSDEVVRVGRIVAVSDNPISRALAGIGAATGRSVTVLPDDDPSSPVRSWLDANPLGPADAVVLCDHDAPAADAILAAALAGAAGYVAVLGSRRRAADLFLRLAATLDEATLQRLHSPAGLDLGGKGPGDIALSVMAEIVAVSHGRSGGPMST